jgi:hypothetical protein
MIDPLHAGDLRAAGYLLCLSYVRPPPSKSQRRPHRAKGTLGSLTLPG